MLNTRQLFSFLSFCVLMFGDRGKIHCPSHKQTLYRTFIFYLIDKNKQQKDRCGLPAME